MEGEIKKCPKCGNSFMCNNHNIIKCGCMEVPLNNTAREIISEQYIGCLCVNCLQDIAEEADCISPLEV